MKALSKLSRLRLDDFMNQPQDENPTIYDVAKRSGLSIATVSRVLNSPEQVTPETRKKVLKVIEELATSPKHRRALAGLTNKSGLEVKLKSYFGFLSCKQSKKIKRRKKQGAMSNEKANWKTHA